MKWATAVYAMLTADTTLTTATGTRIYPVVAKQNAARPFIVYTGVSVEPHDTKSGVSTLDIVRVQFDIYADTHASAQDTADTLRTAIDGHTGSHGGRYIDGVRYLSESDDYEAETSLYRKSMDFQIRVK